MYSYDGQNYNFEATVITNHNGKATEAVQYDKILRYSSPVTIELREVEPEISYIDMIRLKVIANGETYYLLPLSASRDLNKLMKSDDSYLVTEIGDNVNIIFDKFKDNDANREVGVEVEGYYDRQD
jgi:hypothetical protein